VAGQGVGWVFSTFTSELQAVTVMAQTELWGSIVLHIDSRLRLVRDW
jgi:hypothetical protein